jgi:hypothetical protein
MDHEGPAGRRYLPRDRRVVARTGQQLEDAADALHAAGSPHSPRASHVTGRRQSRHTPDDDPASRLDVVDDAGHFGGTMGERFTAAIDGMADDLLPRIDA